MKPSQVHLDFWNTRKVPVPRFASGWKTVRNRPTIDQVINANAGQRTDCFAACNLVELLKLMRRNHPRTSLWYQCERLAHIPGTVIDPKRRASYARLWAKRSLRKPL